MDGASALIMDPELTAAVTFWAAPAVIALLWCSVEWFSRETLSGFFSSSLLIRVVLASFLLSATIGEGDRETEDACDDSLELSSSLLVESSACTSIGLEADCERDRLYPAATAVALRLPLASIPAVSDGSVSLRCSRDAAALRPATRVVRAARPRAGPVPFGAPANVLLSVIAAVPARWGGRWLLAVLPAVVLGVLHGGCSREMRWCGRRSSTPVAFAVFVALRSSTGKRCVSSPCRPVCILPRFGGIFNNYRYFGFSY